MECSSHTCTCATSKVQNEGSRDVIYVALRLSDNTNVPLRAEPHTHHGKLLDSTSFISCVRASLAFFFGLH